MADRLLNGAVSQQVADFVRESRSLTEPQVVRLTLAMDELSLALEPTSAERWSLSVDNVIMLSTARDVLRAWLTTTQHNVDRVRLGLAQLTAHL